MLRVKRRKRETNNEQYIEQNRTNSFMYIYL